MDQQDHPGSVIVITTRLLLKCSRILPLVLFSSHNKSFSKLFSVQSQYRPQVDQSRARWLMNWSPDRLSEFLCLFLKFCCQMKPIKLSRQSCMDVIWHYVTITKTSAELLHDNLKCEEKKLKLIIYLFTNVHILDLNRVKTNKFRKI